MAKKERVLNDDHLLVLNKLLKSCAETGEFLERCKSCGIDVDKEIAMNEDQQTVARNLKKTFFPEKV